MPKCFQLIEMLNSNITLTCEDAAPFLSIPLNEKKHQIFTFLIFIRFMQQSKCDLCRTREEIHFRDNNCGPHLRFTVIHPAK